MESRNPDFRRVIEAVFDQAAFITDVGIELVDMGPGWCETTLPLAPRHLQQNGFVHAGVQATIADHTAGAASSTLVAADEYVLTLEFKINLLRAAKGDRLRCRAQVLKPGSRFTIVESEVYAQSAGRDDQLVSKATISLAVLKQG